MAYQFPAAGGYNTPVLNTASMEYYTWYYVDATRGYIWQRNPQYMGAFSSLNSNTANYAVTTGNALYVQTPDSGSNGALLSTRKTTAQSIGAGQISVVTGFNALQYSNVGAQWNGTTGIFTAAFPGIYKVEWNGVFGLGTFNTYQSLETYICKNNVTYTYLTQPNYSSTTAYINIPGFVTAIISLNTNDYISFKVYNGSTAAKNLTGDITIQQVT